jgi:hypothetical protein
VLVACLVIVGPSAVIGISAGAVLGRTYWTSVATGVPSIAQPVLSLATTALVMTATLATGFVLAIGATPRAKRILLEDTIRRD